MRLSNFLLWRAFLHRDLRHPHFLARVPRPESRRRHRRVRSPSAAFRCGVGFPPPPSSLTHPRGGEYFSLSWRSPLPDPAPVYLIRDNAIVYRIAPNSALNIGRHDSNDIVFDDHKVSREHAVLKYADGKFTLIDLASTHGTFVNGEGIARQVIGPGTRIHIVTSELFLTDTIPEALRGAKIVTSKGSRMLDRRIKFFRRAQRDFAPHARAVYQSGKAERAPRARDRRRAVPRISISGRARSST